MKSRLAIALSLVLLASAGAMTNASAQGKTRAEVRQELIQAENNGSRFVTDSSYPEINPIFAQQAAQAKQQSDTGVGSGMSGSSAAGQRVPSPGSIDSSSCVGPMSFCSLYFGS
ncbi:DUF4148 domain-containing protein [Paraburkholderia xenovorans]|uniref:DUF4148 domain-containing protein n=1 Tax=Paraburkholderia xenovorans TaxID=36873 RepID=UPI0038BAB074